MVSITQWTSNIFGIYLFFAPEDCSSTSHAAWTSFVIHAVSDSNVWPSFNQSWVPLIDREEQNGAAIGFFASGDIVYQTRSSKITAGQGSGATLFTTYYKYN